MNIGNLSPLQRWLERINDYITQENLLKARFASLLLPIFETLELLSVLKKICFKSSRRPSESFSNLTSKAHILAVNIIFAGFEGFKDPLFNYQYHQTCGLTYLNKQKVKFKDDKKQLSESKHRRSSSSPAKSTLQKLRDAHHVRARYQQDDILDRHYSLTAKTRETPKRPGLPTEWLAQHSESKRPIEDEKKVDTEWQSLGFLIQGPMNRNGSWRAPRKGPATFKPHTRPNILTVIDPSILHKLAEAIDSGFLETLNFDETLHLHLNVQYILKQNRTFKGSSTFTSSVQITSSIQSILIARWVENDYQNGVFYKYCLSLIKRMTNSIQLPSSAISAENRLFKKASKYSLSKLFEEWHEAQEHSLEHKGNSQKTKLPLVIHDHYEVLKAYLQNLPTDLRKKWKNLNEARNEAEWDTALTRLPPQDSQLIQALLMLLKLSYEKIWLGQLDAMLTAITPLLAHMCPNSDYLKRHMT